MAAACENGSTFVFIENQIIGPDNGIEHSSQRIHFLFLGFGWFGEWGVRSPALKLACKGNDFRLIVAVAYQIGVVYVKFVGTHAEYDKVDAATVEME